MYGLACGVPARGGWGIAPSEFWKMTPYEWWQLFDQNIGHALKERADTMDRLHRLLREAKQQETKP